MPNKSAKLRKQQRLKKNKELKTKGRTKKQYQKWLKKQGDKNVTTKGLGSLLGGDTIKDVGNIIDSMLEDEKLKKQNWNPY